MLMFEYDPVNDDTITPSERAIDDAVAIDMSHAVLYFLLMNIMMNDEIITDGADISIT